MTKRIYLSVDTQVMSGEYESMISCTWLTEGFLKCEQERHFYFRDIHFSKRLGVIVIYCAFQQPIDLFIGV